MRVGRFLVQGVDVWLNNPRRPLEASGTSGMKAAQNGVPNVSVLDGWWDEGYEGDNGWAIGGRETQPRRGGPGLAGRPGPVPAPRGGDHPELLRARRRRAMPPRWLAVMRRAMATALWRFSTTRMLHEYTERLYLPAAGVAVAGADASAGSSPKPARRPSMAPRISLALAIHNHQPVGNFGWVFAEVYEQAYLPMLEALERHPSVRLSLHYSGPLLDWLQRRATRVHRPAASARRRDQVEILGGGYYEPVLASLPERDRIGQLRRMADELERLFGRRPRGAWLAERVWEPDLPTSLVAGGYDWTILDDAHFRAAAIPEEDLWGPYTTEDQGQRLTVFGTEQGLRYRIPFRDVEEVIDYLRDHATDDGDAGRDDGRRRREVRRLADDLGALLGRRPLGRPVLRGPRGERRLADHDHAVGAGWPTTAHRARLRPDRLVRRDGRMGAAGRREPRLRRRPPRGAGRGAARGALAARRLLAQLPGQVPRDQRPPQADAADLRQGRRHGRRARPRRARSTTSTAASRTTATGTACSAASTSATCAWPPTST